MWWEQLLVFGILAVAAGFALRRMARSVIGRKPCCNCSATACPSRGEAPSAGDMLSADRKTTPDPQVTGDAA